MSRSKVGLQNKTYPMFYRRTGSLHSIQYHYVYIDNEFAFSGHNHPGIYEILVVTKGSIGITFKNRDSLTLHTNNLLVVSGADFHTIHGIEIPAAYFNPHFEVDLPLVRDLAASNSVYSVVGIACDRFWERTEESRQYAAEDRLLNVLTLLRCIGQTRPLSKIQSVTSNSATPSMSAWFESKLEALIDSNPVHMHSRAELARTFCLEEHYLSSKARQLTGLTLMEMYYRVKMRRARKMLVDGRSIKEAAEKSGFANQFHFSRKYRQVYGYPPSEDRQQ